jgi:hypothetical protein
MSVRGASMSEMSARNALANSAPPVPESESVSRLVVVGGLIHVNVHVSVVVVYAVPDR